MKLSSARLQCNFSSLPWKLDNPYYHISITDFFPCAFKILYSFHKSLVSIASTIRKYLYNFVTLALFSTYKCYAIRGDIRYQIPTAYLQENSYMYRLFHLQSTHSGHLSKNCWYISAGIIFVK